MTPEQQMKYIITFDELQELKPDIADGMYRSTKEMNQEKTIFRVLSYPYIPTPEEQRINDMIMKLERLALDYEGISEDGYSCRSKGIREAIALLRGDEG
jgi:hypothetical protein